MWLCFHVWLSFLAPCGSWYNCYLLPLANFVTLCISAGCLVVYVVFPCFLFFFSTTGPRLGELTRGNGSCVVGMGAGSSLCWLNICLTMDRVVIYGIVVCIQLLSWSVHVHTHRLMNIHLDMRMGHGYRLHVVVLLSTNLPAMETVLFVGPHCCVSYLIFTSNQRFCQSAGTGYVLSATVLYLSKDHSSEWNQSTCFVQRIITLIRQVIDHSNHDHIVDTNQIIICYRSVSSCIALNWSAGRQGGSRWSSPSRHQAIYSERHKKVGKWK